jgi:hypothetical protein
MEHQQDYNWDSICRTLGIDGEGNVYGSFGQGEIYKYSPATDTITKLKAQIPIRQRGTALGRDYNKSETECGMGWRGQALLRHGWERALRLQFCGIARERSEAAWPMAIPAMADQRDVSYATLSLTLGHDRKLYYAAAEKEFD